jgi:HEAT repeat protein
MKSVLRFCAWVILLGLLGLAAYYLYDTLKSKSKYDKLAEIIHLEDRREPSPGLRHYLDDDDTDVRARAALAIGRIGGKASGTLLYDLLSDPSHDVARAAAVGLGLSGLKEYAAPLLDAANELPAGIAAAAVEAAGRLADSTMVEIGAALTEHLAHPAPEVREAACYAIFRAGARTQMPAIISMLTSEPDQQVREAGLYTLARFRTKEAATIYTDYLADSEPYVRAWAVRGLGAVGTKEADHLLAIALNDQDKNVVAQVVNELADRQTPPAQTQLAHQLMIVNDTNLIMVICDAMRRQQ